MEGGGLPHSSASLLIWNETDLVHLSRAAFSDIFRSIQATANADRGSSPKTSGPRYLPIINNVVDHRLAASQHATAQWLLGTAAAAVGAATDTWTDRRSRGGSVAPWRGGQSCFNPYTAPKISENYLIN